MTLDEFFLGFENSRPIFEAVRSAIDTIGVAEIRVSKSQITFWRQKSVVRVWIPARYLHGNLAPLVLTLAFRHRDSSLRWKEIVEPALGRFIHHLELYTIADLDDEVYNWLRIAWINAA